ncbi:aldehyde dehydrogenase family protein [Arthrobacter zhaoguopingii]|uniref:aldehyde dehydrogenase family protein n=1 Tax=Arthrobacter zhaoguopingii TaxID=2681491 RepID=UPI003CCCBF2C
MQEADDRNPPLPQNHPQSGPNRHRYGPVRDPKCGPCPHRKTRLLTAKNPVGPCLLITPRKFPRAMAARTITPAIAAGCAMVLKPADFTP